MIGTWHRYLMVGAVVAVLAPAAASAQGASWKHPRKTDVRQESRVGRTSNERNKARVETRGQARKQRASAARRDAGRYRDAGSYRGTGRYREARRYNDAGLYRAQLRTSIVRDWQEEMRWERSHYRDGDFLRLMRVRRERLLRRCERARSLYYQRYGYDGGWVISPLALQGIIDTRDLHLDIVLRALGGGFLSH